jgi:FMN phosphatase YigB (HAD superfamily)
VSDAAVRMICFDLGRVLIQLCDGWHHACEVAGVPSPPPFDDEQRAALHNLVCVSETGHINQAEFCRRASSLMGLDLEHVVAVSTAFLRAPFPGAVELVQSLKRRGFLTACLSNTNDSHWEIMCADSGRCALSLGQMDFRFGSHEMGVRKPDEAIYRHVEQVAQVTGRQILFFDDSLENIEGAKRCGWRAHQVMDRVDPVREMRQKLAEEGINI